MKSVLRATNPSDLPRISELLRRALHVGSEASFLGPAMMRWKYWDAREDWGGARSYVLEWGGAIVAHAGLWPVTLPSDTGEPARGIHMIDWVAAADAPGAGLALVQKLTGMFDFIFSIGGSETTQKLLPAFGFRVCATTWRGARPLRPVGQILSHPYRNWKLAPRLVRNTLWAHYPVRLRRQGWQATQVAPDLVPSALAEAVAKGGPALPRPPGFFAYLSRCPGTKFHFYRVGDPAGPRGIFALAIVGGQARLAGVWLRDPCFESWKAVYSLAQESARQLREACEIIALGAQKRSGDAASASGLRVFDGPSVYLLDKKSKLARDVEFQLCDNDAAFLTSVGESYWT